jgi:hypothetical protein
MYCLVTKYPLTIALILYAPWNVRSIDIALTFKVDALHYLRSGCYLLGMAEL